jgi:hypothetical protein
MAFGGMRFIEYSDGHWSAFLSVCQNPEAWIPGARIQIDRLRSFGAYLPRRIQEIAAEETENYST